MSTDRTPEQRAAIRASFAVGLAVAAYGVSFGALAVASGLDVWQACALSLLMFSGGSQFALIGILASGGASAVAPAIASSTLVATRLSLYGLRVAPILGGPWGKKLLAAHWTIDETTAVAIAQPEGPAQRTGFWWTGAIIYAGWNLTTLAGALLGDLLGDVSAYGLDAAAAAAFLGLIWPRLKALQPVVVAIGAAVVAAVLMPFVPPGIPVLVAAVVAVAVGLTNWLGTKESDAIEREPDPMGER